MPHLESISLVAMMMLSGMISALAAALPAGSQLMSDVQLRMICISGALAGGLASLRVIRDHQSRSAHRRDYLGAMAGKVFTATAISVIFTPVFMHWQNLPLEVDWVLGISGAFALFNRLVIRVVSIGLDRWLRRFMPRNDDDDDERRL